MISFKGQSILSLMFLSWQGFIIGLKICTFLYTSLSLQQNQPVAFASGHFVIKLWSWTNHSYRRLAEDWASPGQSRISNSIVDLCNILSTWFKNLWRLIQSSQSQHSVPIMFSPTSPPSSLYSTSPLHLVTLANFLMSFSSWMAVKCKDEAEQQGSHSTEHATVTSACL